MTITMNHSGMKSDNVLAIGDYPQTLAVVRSLGRAGYRVTVAYDQPRPVSTYSRYCIDSWECPEFDGPDFKPALHHYLQQHSDVAALYPIGISAIRAVQDFKRELDAEISVIAVSASVLAVFDDKEHANVVASQAGVKVPRSVQVEDVDTLREAALDLNYPLIIKSANNAGPVFGRKAYLIENAPELESAFATWPPGHKLLMVQRYITGKVVACDFVANNGQIIAYYQGAHTRTDAPDGTGYVVDFRAIEPTPELFAVLTKIASRTEYSGPGLLQCVVCADTGSHYFLELNPRLSAGIAEAVNAGLDLPLIALHNGLGSNIPPAYEQAERRYSMSAHTYWLERDVLGWVKHRGNLTFSESLHWVRSMITDLFTSDAHVNWSWADPAPSARILTGHLRRALSARLAPIRYRIKAHVARH